MPLPQLRSMQGRRKVSNIEEAPIQSVPKFAENIERAQLLAAPNIGGARAPVPPPVPTALTFIRRGMGRKEKRQKFDSSHICDYLKVNLCGSHSLELLR